MRFRCPFLDASGEPYSSKLAPGILYPSSVWLFLLSPWFYCVVLRVRCFENSNSPSICDFGALFWTPLGSHILQNWRLESYILVLFDYFCYLPGFIVSCCALYASKTQTDLVYAMSVPLFEASGETCSSKLTPGILYPNTVWNVLLSPWCYRDPNWASSLGERGHIDLRARSYLWASRWRWSQNS